MRYLIKSTPVDSLLALLLTVLTVVSLLSIPKPGPGPLVYALAVLSIAPIALRQVAPVATLLVVVGALLLGTLLYPNNGVIPSGGIGMVIALFTVATMRPTRTTAFCFGATVGTLVMIDIALRPIDQAQVQLVQSVVVLVGAWALGHSTRKWALRAERLAGEAVHAVSEERVRIARELHDVVAHHMSVISLQAGVAEFVLDADPDTAKAAIHTVGESGREAMRDMRRMLDVLRVETDDTEPELQPQPGLADLDALLHRTRVAGLEVSLAVTGPARALPAGADLCAYRVVQEALTNVLKHAGPGVRSRVVVGWGTHILTVLVSDDGSRTPAPAAPGSHGIRGMRERAALYGGVLRAGPGPTGGFEVLLRLPLDPAEREGGTR